MPDPVEIEIKLIATPAMLGALLSHPSLAGAQADAALVTTWVDTDDGRLHRHGATLRVRANDGQFEQTLKLNDPTGSRVRRKEWNAAIPDARFDVERFPGKVRQRLEGLLAGGTPLPLGMARVARIERQVACGATTLAVAFDQGEIVAGAAVAAVSELELEVMRGALADALRLALELPLGPQLYWSVRSKSERGHALAQGLPLPAQAARAPQLRAGMSVAAGFRAIAWNGLGHLLANYPLVVAHGAPAGVHQARVALRRLRVALKLFRGIADDHQAPVLRAALGTVARAMAPARALAVLRLRLARAAADAGGCAGDLLDHVDACLGRETRAAQGILASAEFQRLLFELALWVEEGAWLRDLEQRAKTPSLHKFGADSLDRIHRALRRQHGRLATMSEMQRHQVRLDAKHLRYAASFFESAWPGASRRRKFATALANLQDSLGELNDQAEALHAHEHLFEGVDERAAAPLRASLAALLATRPEPARKPLQAAQRALDWLVSAEPWWK